jgi:hypothetical protein
VAKIDLAIKIKKPSFTAKLFCRMDIFESNPEFSTMEQDNQSMMIHLFPDKLYTLPEYESVEWKDLEGNENQSPQLLLLLKERSGKSLQAEVLELLKKMTDWMGVEKSKAVAWIVGDEPVSFHELHIDHRVENIICYGCLPADIGLQLDFSINKSIRFMNCRIIFTASFSEVQKNEKLKKEFFAEVQHVFQHLKPQKS